MNADDSSEKDPRDVQKTIGEGFGQNTIVQQFAHFLALIYEERGEVAPQLEPEQIQKALENDDRADDRSHRTTRVAIGAGLIGVVILLSFVGFLCWLFLSHDKPEHISAIIAGLSGLIGGLVGGFGIGRAFPGKGE